ncbi:VOC family protein [Algiphilus aromaticivorans]|jgi:predicted 3-demethylubiquinone-9 3-methyltransferase (glyoxalase superfamily)|uniref:VOC family protein n=1 Tax=Algiphilus aromaticivorans TaxID=382454 RepID=UPI0005C19D69|nr:VOC family protein [Algiphilus aromaticivorans]
MQLQKITPFIWFDGCAEEAAKFYVAVFPDAEILQVARYTEAGREQHGQVPGTAMTVDFTLAGQRFTALNGGPHFPLSPAISFVVHCEDQAEIDRYWTALSEGGDPAAQRCGWLADRFGLSWQIVPRQLPELMRDPARAERVMAAMMPMRKLDVAVLEQA